MRVLGAGLVYGYKCCKTRWNANLTNKSKINAKTKIFFGKIFVPKVILQLKLMYESCNM